MATPDKTKPKTRLLKDFPKDMAEVYAMGRKEGDRPSVPHPAVKESSGGGAMPEQHWGTLKNGMPFYFRMRHSWASLCIGPKDAQPSDLPMVNPEYNMEFPLANVPFWLGVFHGVSTSGEDRGSFHSDEECAEVFGQCLALHESPDGS